MIYESMLCNGHSCPPTVSIHQISYVPTYRKPCVIIIIILIMTIIVLNDNV